MKHLTDLRCLVLHLSIPTSGLRSDGPLRSHSFRPAHICSDIWKARPHLEAAAVREGAPSLHIAWMSYRNHKQERNYTLAPANNRLIWHETSRWMSVPPAWDPEYSWHTKKESSPADGE